MAENVDVLQPYIKIKAADAVRCLALLRKLVPKKATQICVCFCNGRLEIRHGQFPVSAPAEGYWPQDAIVARPFFDCVNRSLRDMDPNDYLTIYGSEKGLKVGVVTIGCSWGADAEVLTPAAHKVSNSEDNLLDWIVPLLESAGKVAVSAGQEVHYVKCEALPNLVLKVRSTTIKVYFYSRITARPLVPLESFGEIALMALGKTAFLEKLMRFNAGRR